VFVPNVVRSLSLSGSEGMGGSEDWTDESLSLCVFRYLRVEDSFEISFRFSSNRMLGFLNIDVDLGSSCHLKGFGLNHVNFLSTLQRSVSGLSS
jgi:hypothetical protein